MPKLIPDLDGNYVYVPDPGSGDPAVVLPAPTDPGDGSPLLPPELDDTYSVGDEAWPTPSADDLQLAELDALGVDDGDYSVLSSGSKPGQIISTVDNHLSRALGCSACPFQGPRDMRGSGRACALRCWQSNNAVDIALPVGYAVRACRAGTVSATMGYGLLSGSGLTAGYRLHVVHANGMISWYQHMRPPLRPRGSRVAQGDILGYVGYWGFVPHCHFAVTPPFDPAAFAPLVWSKLGRQVPTAPRPGGDTGATPEPWIQPKAKTTEDAWRDLMRTQGVSKRGAERALLVARQAVNKLLS